MRLLLLRGWTDAVGLGVENRVRAEFPFLVVEHYAAVASLTFRLKQAGTSRTLGVLLIPQSAAELGDLVQESGLFDDLKVLLVLPDHGAAIVADGHRLKPSLMVFSDGDPAPVCAVIDKMLERRWLDVA
jgi:hypothetical protein